MKKSRFIWVLLCLVVFITTGCTSSSNVKNEEIKENEQIVKEFNEINMMVDPRIELLSVIIYLCPEYDESTNSIVSGELTYKKDVEEYFGAYKDHKAVKLFKSMYNRGFSYDAPPTSMLFLTNTPNLVLRDDVDKSDFIYNVCMQRAGGEKNFLKFVEALNDFCIDTNFYDFYNDHLDYYNNIIDNTINGLEDIDYVNQVQDYYGKKQNGFNIVLNGMLYANNYGPRIQKLDGSYDLFAILGSSGIESDLPIFNDEIYFKYIVRHEFGHSFVNYLTDENIDEVNKCEKLFEPIKEAMDKQAYNTWETSLNEHIVRSVVVRITETYGSKKEADEYLKMDQSNSFIYEDDIIEILKNEYEPNRNKYKTFEEFYPEILNLLKEKMQ